MNTTPKGSANTLNADKGGIKVVQPKEDEAQNAIIRDYLEQFTQEIQQKIKVQCTTLNVPRKAHIEVQPMEEIKQ